MPSGARVWGLGYKSLLLCSPSIIWVCSIFSWVRLGLWLVLPREGSEVRWGMAQVAVGSGLWLLAPGRNQLRSFPEWLSMLLSLTRVLGPAVSSGPPACPGEARQEGVTEPGHAEACIPAPLPISGWILSLQRGAPCRESRQVKAWLSCFQNPSLVQKAVWRWTCQV